MKYDEEETTSQIVLAFHKLSSNFSYGVSNYSPRRFWVFINALPESIKARLVITFDDGYEHIYDTVLKLIETLPLKPIIFIPTKYIGKDNSWDYSYFFKKEKHLSASSIKMLSDNGVIFGSHSHNHLDLTNLSSEQIKFELTESQKILQDITGKSVDCISYPFGKSNKIVRDIAKELGYSDAFTMVFPESSDRELEQGRIPVYSFDTRFTLMQKINKGKLYKFEKLKSTIASRLSQGTTILQKLRKQ